MSAAGLRDLLERIREHPAFPDLLAAVEAPPVKQYRPGGKDTAAEQQAEWIFRSGRHAQHERWREVLTQYVPHGETHPSQQEKS